MIEAALKAQNWEAFLHLEFRSGQERTHLIPIRRYGPLSVQRAFYPEQECCHVYLLHPPGGVVGGDKLELRVDVEANAKALLTTPGATKFYLTAAETAQVSQNMELGVDSQLEFLPQENIYFPGSRVRSKTSIRVNPTSRLVFWEKHCFGRPANKEFYATGELVAEIEIRDEKQLIFVEKQRIDAAELNRFSGLRQNPVMGSFLVFGASLEETLVTRLREITPLQGLSGITQLRQKLLVARYMGPSTRDMNSYFVRLWKLLRPTILQREASLPRIWNT